MRSQLKKPPVKNSPSKEAVSVISSKQKAFMYSCLVPVFGAIPSLMALISDRGSKQLKDIAQISVMAALVWLSAYVGLGDDSQIAQLSEASIGSAYFMLNIYLMWRLSQGKKVAIPKIPIE
jgi:hypothetical protein